MILNSDIKAQYNKVFMNDLEYQTLDKIYIQACYIGLYDSINYAYVIYQSYAACEGGYVPEWKLIKAEKKNDILYLYENSIPLDEHSLTYILTLIEEDGEYKILSRVKE